MGMPTLKKNPVPVWEALSDPVYPLVDKDLEEFGASQALRQVFSDRDAAGKKKYGVALATFNNRDPLSDAIEELIDTSVYLRQAMEEAYHGQQWKRADKIRANYHLALDMLIELFETFQAELIE